MGVVMTEPAAQGGVGIVKTQVATIELPAGGFRLESGASLPELVVAYETYGTLTAERDNAIYICPTLTSDAHAAGTHDGTDATRGWWDGMIGPGKGIDTNHYFVICANILGGCKGTTGPSSVNPATGKPYGSAFPAISVGDMVNAHCLLVKQLGVERLAAVVGGSLGGMHALDWTIRFPEMVDRCVCIASATSLSAQALAFDIIGRNAITSDPDWQGGDYYGTGRVPSRGLAQARRIGHVTYLSAEMMDTKFGRDRTNGAEPRSAAPAGHPGKFSTNFEVESYLDHQGEKFVRRFDANAYLHITRAIDEYDLVEKFGSLEKAFEPIRAKVLVAALSSDWLFPPEQSMEVARALLAAGKRVSYCTIEVPYGHDAFLVEIGPLGKVVRAFLPWVGRPAAPAPAARPGKRRDRNREYEVILDMVKEGATVLDLGCGNGRLLTQLAGTRKVSGIGVDIDFAHVVETIDQGHDVVQCDIDKGLAMFPAGAYDYAILSETLQEVRNPKSVLKELLRVAKKGIVTFPNFGKWSHRVHLWFTGRMPKGGSLPFEWYDTPNIHLFTLRDFVDLCHRDGIKILKLASLAKGVCSRCLVALGLRNLGADCVLVKIAREDAED